MYNKKINIQTCGVHGKPTLLQLKLFWYKKLQMIVG